MASSRKTVRIFISSTFHGMQAERDHLAKVVCPNLRRMCERRNLSVEFIDGCAEQISNDVDEEVRSLKSNLDAIDRCRPFFLGIIGERYGPSIPTLPDEVAEIFPQLLVYEGRSRMELEFRHAIHARPVPAAGIYFFRRRELLDQIPEARRVDFETENAQASKRLRALKVAIKDAGWTVKEYDGRWDPECNNVGELEDFGEAVRKRPPIPFVQGAAERSPAFPGVELVP